MRGPTLPTGLYAPEGLGVVEGEGDSVVLGDEASGGEDPGLGGCGDAPAIVPLPKNAPGDAD